MHNHKNVSGCGTRSIRLPERNRLAKALSFSLLIAAATGQAAAQDAGQIGDPESWRTEEFQADWGLGAIGAQYAYARGLTGDGIAIGQWDTGVDLTHPEFAGRGHVALTLNDPGCARENRGQRIVFDAGVGGCMLTKGDEYSTDAYWVFQNDGSSYAYALYGSHGTHVAGTMVASRDGQGMHGVAYGSKLVTARFFADSANFWEQNEDGSYEGPFNFAATPGSGNVEGANQLYQQLRDQGARALNIEVEYYTDGMTVDDLRAQYQDAPGFWDALADGAIDSDIINVVAAGNSANIPSLFPGVPLVRPDAEPYYLAVGALDQLGEGSYEIAEYSNRCDYAMNWCVMAPGSGITSSVIEDKPYWGSFSGSGTPEDPYVFEFEPGSDVSPGHDYADYSGTSMAAPHAIGALALLFERFPYLSSTQVRDVLLTTATDMGAAGVDPIYGWGMIDLRKAIEGPGQLRVDTDVVMNQAAGGTKVWDGPAWDDWTNDIGGPGRLSKSGIGWLRLTGDNSFAGATLKQGVLEFDGDNSLTGDVLVDGGMLVLNGSMTGSNLTVNQGIADIQGTLSGGSTLIGTGGLLAGTGTLGDTVVQGVVAPGNSIGTLTIDGNYTQAAGSFYRVELEPPSSADLLHVTGTATLQGGTVELYQAPGTYLLGQSYNILSADGGVTGMFAGLDADAFDTPFLKFELDYSANDVDLNIARGVPFASVADTPNQLATATALDALPDANQLVQTLVLTSEDEAVAAFDLLSGEMHAGVRSALVDSSRMPRDAALNRARATSDGFSSQAYDGAPNGAWAEAYASGGNLNSDGNAERVNQNSHAILVGYDRQFDAGWRLGAMLGSGRTDFSAVDRASDGKADTRHFGVYGGGHWGGFGVRAGWLYAIHDIDTDRNVVYPGFSDRLRANYDGRTRQAVIEAGYRFDQGSWEAEPFVQYADVRMSHDRINERGGAAALTGASSDSKVGIATAGARFNVNLKGSQQEATWLSLRGMVGYRKTSGDRSPQTELSFAGGPVFTVSGAPLTDDAVVAEMGFAARTSQSTMLEVGYGGQFASEGKDHGANLRFSWQF